MINQVASQIIIGKSRNLQKLLRHLSEIVTSTFKVGTVCRFASPSFPGRAGVFPTIFVLHLNDLPSKALSYYQFRLYINSINFLMS